MTIQDAALSAHDAGISVIPIRSDGTKRPPFEWKAYQSDRPERALVETWFRNGQYSGFAGIGGAVSGGLEILDFDDAATYQVFLDTGEAIGLGDLLTWIRWGYEERTPAEGTHLLYRCDAVGGNDKLARRLNPDGSVTVLIETRAEGGYAILAPSNGTTHPTGKPWRMVSGGPSTISSVTAEERAMLFALARSFDEMPSETHHEARGEQATPDGVNRPGDDFRAKHATLDAFRDIIEPHGWVLTHRRGDVGYFRRPGKTEGWSASFGHNGGDWFYVWTSSTTFEPERGYNPFSTYAHLNHGGDFAEAARSLGRQGYGEPSTRTQLVTRWSTNGASDHTKEQTESSDGLLLTDFASYLPERKYIYIPTGKVWEPAGINCAFPPIGSGKEAIKQSSLIDEGCPVHDLSWVPGKPQIIEGAFLDQGGWLPKAGARVYNSYRPPKATNGDPANADQWIEHIRRVYPDAADHLIAWLAHRVQRPGEKINHALILGGAPGIGKDTILEPVRHAIGPWNFGDVSPIELMGRFNAFLKTVVLRVSELRDLGDRDRYGFYEHTKTLIAAPPDTLTVDEKNIRAYRIPNLVGVVFTTNHRTDGLFLPADDRRHFVAWSELSPSDFADGYWSDIYQWFEADGASHVAAYLADYDLSAFSPKAPPPKTAAFWDIVSASRAPEDADVATAVEKLNEPDALTISDLSDANDDLEFRAWLRDRKNSRQLPHRLEAAGYVAMPNPDRKDGLWIISGKRQMVYAKRNLVIRDRIAAAQKRSDRQW
jgi:hypothetical protein